MIEKILERFRKASVNMNIPVDADSWSYIRAISKCEAIVKEVAKEYEGRVIELPCKVGDTLYINDFRCDFHMNLDRPYEVKVWHIVINGRNDFIDVILEDGTMYQFYLSDIGKTIFLTKAEAEEALARMEGE